MQFSGFEIAQDSPDQKTIWKFRERLAKANAFDALFASFHEQLHARGYKPTGGQIVDATLVAAPRQRMTNDEKQCAKASQSASQI